MPILNVNKQYYADARKQMMEKLETNHYEEQLKI